MNPTRFIRRQAAIAFAAVCLLVCGGLGWATLTAFRLERLETRRERDQAFDRNMQKALSHLDHRVSEILFREDGRPYEHYLAKYRPVEAFDDEESTNVSDQIWLYSPLRPADLPRWILLHFMAQEIDGRPIWSSPYPDVTSPFAAPVQSIAPDDRPRLVGPANWLASLADAFSPYSLQDRLEQAVAARFDRSELLRRAAGGIEILDSMEDEPSGDDGASDFARRGQRLLELERAVDDDRCIPQQVVNANLGLNNPRNVEDAPQCFPMWRTKMTPVWLSLTDDDTPQLAFLRTVVVEDFDACTLQGFLIDWPALKTELLSEIDDIFSNARLEIIDDADLLRADMMLTLPARLVVPPPDASVAAAISPGISLGLGVTWLVSLLGLAAIGYGLMKYVALTERRMQFVAAVTHELRTPLTSFQLYTDLLAETANDPDADERRDRYLRALRAESGRLARLVENVLAYSRIGDATPALRPEPTRPADLLAGVQEATAEKLAAANKQLVIENRCSDSAPLTTDREFVEQILTSLIENACKYSASAEDPRIWLIAEPQGNVIVFAVEDAGRGVASPDRRRIFEPFRRGATDDPGRAGGMGLGLALSRYWAQCLGGQLHLEPAHRNGTHLSRFALRLPVAGPTTATAQELNRTS